MGAYDATTKYLIESHAADWLRLAGLRPAAGSVRVVDADLSTITSVPDKLLRVGRGRRGYAVHVEFQSARDRWLDERVLAYNVLARRRHGVPVRSVVFLLRPEAGPPGVRGSVRWPGDTGSPLSFDYQLIRVWTLPAAELLDGPLGTLPLAPVAAVDRAALPGVIRQMRDRLDREVAPAVAGELWTATRILMGMRYNRPEIRSLLQGVRHMRESVTYQEIVDEGRVEGEQRLLLRMASARFGKPPKAVLSRLKGITDLEQLDRLGVSMLSASGWKDWMSTAALTK